MADGGEDTAGAMIKAGNGPCLLLAGMDSAKGTSKIEKTL